MPSYKHRSEEGILLTTMAQHKQKKQGRRLDIRVILLLAGITTCLILGGLKTAQVYSTSFTATTSGSSYNIGPYHKLIATSTTDDGWIYNTSATYVIAHKSMQGIINDTATTMIIGQDSTYRVARAFVFFNTSTIPSNATISSVSLKLYGAADASSNDFTILVYSGQPTYPHRPLQPGDFSNGHYTTNVTASILNTTAFTTNGYNTISLNTSVVNRTGFTKVALLSSRDVYITTPQTGVTEYFAVYTSEQGSGYQPRLEVVYS